MGRRAVVAVNALAAMLDLDRDIRGTGIVAGDLLLWDSGLRVNARDHPDYHR